MLKRMFYNNKIVLQSRSSKGEKMFSNRLKPRTESFGALSDAIKKNNSSQQTKVKGSFNALKNAISKDTKNKKDK